MRENPIGYSLLFVGVYLACAADIAAQDAQNTGKVYTLGAVSKAHLETKPRKRFTVLDVIGQVANKKSDLSNVVLLRLSPASAKTTFLFVRIDVRRMIQTGNTKDNIQIESNDLFYVAKRRWIGSEKVGRFEVLAAALAGTPTTTLEKLVWQHVTAATKSRSAADRVAGHLFFLRHHRDPPTRQKHLLALGGMDKDVDKATLTMVQALRTRDAATKPILVALGMLGAKARAALPALAKLEKDADPRIRELASAAAKKIRQGSAKK